MDNFIKIPQDIIDKINKYQIEQNIKSSMSQREKNIEYQRQYRILNREKISEYKKQYYIENKELIRKTINGKCYLKIQVRKYLKIFFLTNIKWKRNHEKNIKIKELMKSVKNI